MKPPGRSGASAEGVLPRDQGKLGGILSIRWENTVTLEFTLLQGDVEYAQKW